MSSVPSAGGSPHSSATLSATPTPLPKFNPFAANKKTSRKKCELKAITSPT